MTRFDVVPDLDLLGLFLGQDDHLVLVVPPLHHHLNGVAHLSADFAIHFEFADADLALGLVADVDEDVVFVNGDDLSVDHLAFGKTFEALLIQVHELRHAFAGYTVFLDRFFG